ncbi:hypothetical protein E6C76_02370 [Pseudothauera nasutitermitis]|uniref:Dystroglycan-type cadherin-like domain-containing protein n=1 Tax=Pseudothauera nasutitermitis TaxID=2565930 RepID=A0A4V3WCI2_9RHOO|nr:putative Ig domain-containing protein [Pseudothauera nasutitermitis]THF67244.1 hypothetical protein E6C76_02370 [Pseudothauera nasutitermitis]
MTTRRLPLRPHRALALEPRILLDAAAVTTAAEVAAEAVPPTDSAPGVEATPINSTVTITDSTDSFPAVDLFKDVTVSTETGGTEALNELVITVDSSGANQALVIDGSEITLETTDLPGFTSGNGYTYTVSVSGGATTITITLSSADASASDAQALIDGIAYRPLDKTVESGTVTVTLKSLSDDSDTAVLDISATVTIDSQINVAPVLESNGGLESRETFTPDELGIGNSSEVAYSADGQYAYVAGTGGIAVFTVDDTGALSALQTYAYADLGTVTHLVASADGKSLYAISGNSSIVHLSLGEDGRISAAQTIPTGNGNATGGLAISDDGQYVYVGTTNNDVAIYVRDAGTGALSHLDVNGDGYTDRAPGEGGSNTRNGIVITSGNYVYVAYGHISGRLLFVYQRNDDGTLSTAASYAFSTSGGGAVDYGLAVSPDGQYLYVGDPEHNVIRVFHFSDGELTPVETITQSNLASIALGSDGKTLYTTTSDGQLNVYTVAANGTLSLAGSIGTGTSGSDIAIGSDGSLLVTGGNLTRYTVVQTLNLGEPTAFADGLTLKDSNYDALDGGAGNYKGASLTFSADATGGSFGFAAGNDLALSGSTLTLNGAAIASFTVDADGRLTVVFTADTSKAVANQVLRQITYTSAAGTVAGTLVTLTVQGSDDALASNAVTLLLRANEAPQVNAGASTEVGKATTESAYTFVLPADLFTDAGNDKLTWEVTGLPSGLAFDAATRTISGTTTEIGTFTLTVKVTDTHGASASRTLDLVVEQIANRAPTVNADAASTLASATEGTAYSATLDGSLFSDADSLYGDTLSWTVTGLPDGFTFDAATLTISGTSSALGDYNLTVTVTDESGATATVELTLRVISTEEADNNAPVLSTDDINLIHAYEGAITGFSQYVYSLELSSDDSTLIVVGNSSNSHAVTPSGNSTLYVYSRDSDGNLTLVQTFVQGASDDGDDSNGIEIDGLDSATSAVYSADGQYVYLVGKNSSGTYTVTTLQVNADGTLSTTGLSITIADSSTVRQMVVSDDGKALYVVSNSYLYAYSTAADGSLTLLGSYTDGISSSNALAIANGVVYVAGSSRVAIYTVNDDGSLTWATTWSGGSTLMRSIAATDSGYVYVSRGTSGISVLHYDKDSNTVTSVATVSSPGQVWGLSLSSDGTALYAGINGTPSLYIFRVNDDGTLTQSGTMTTSDSRGLRYAMSSDGSSIYIGGFYNVPGLGLISTSMGAAYTEASTALPFADITLSDADYDALADGAGNYNGATITLQREGGANADDSFGFSEDNGLTLDGDSILLNGEKIADFTSADGTLTILFTAEVSTATANAVLRQISYTYQGGDPGASIRLTLGVKDQFASGTDRITLALAVTEVNDAPVVSATPASTKQDAGKAAADLFSDVEVSAVESAQAITSLTLTVSGLRDGASETLRIDGSTVALVEGSGTTTNGHAWSVAIDADSGVATVTISSSEGMSGEAAAALIDGLAYANTDQATGTVGERVVTLVEIQDNGGTDNGGVDTAELSIAATVLVEVGQSPTLGAETGTLDYADLISSNDWPSPYEGIQDVASAGDWVYVVRTAEVFDWNTYQSSNVSTLYVFQRGDDGALTLLQSITSTDVAALTGAAEIQVSADGGTVYVIGGESVALFAVDAGSGGLESLGSFGADLVSEHGLISDVLADGELVYVTAGSELIVFERSGDTLTQKNSYTASGTDAQFSALQLSTDGQYLFVGTSGGSTLASVYRVAGDGSLSFVMAAQGTDPAAEEQYYYTSALTLSPDGATLYAVDYDGSTYRLYTLSVDAGGNLDAVATTELDEAVKGIIVSADGAALFVIGEKSIGIHTRAADGTPTLAQTLEGAGGKNFGELRGATLSADGTRLYVAGTFSWSDGLLVLDLKAASSIHTEDGDAVALLPGGTLSDPQLDALNGGAGNYQGASIVVTRTDDGGGDHDVFGFIDGDGLTFENGSIKRDGAVIASVIDTGSSFIVTFTAAVSQADAQSVLRRIAYSNTSDDPTQYGSQATFSIQFNDGTGYSDELSASVILEGVNDPPVIGTDALAPTYNAEGERVSLFENTVIDTVEAGQQIWQVVVTLEPADAGDVLGVDGGRIALDTATSGTRTTGTGLSYNVQILDGKTIVTLYLMSTPERAAEVIDSLTYGNTGSDLSGTRSISLSVKEYADGGNDTTVVDATAVVTLANATAENTAPSLGGGATTAYTEQADAVAIAPGATVSDAQMDAFNGGSGNYDGAVLTLTLGEGSSTADVLGFAAGSGLTLENGSLKKDGVTIGSVSNADGVLTITFTDANGAIPTTADVQNALRQITYANGSDAPAASVAVSVTLSDQRGLDSAALDFAIAITAVNDVPTIDADPVLSLGDLDHLQTLTDIAGLGTLSSSVVSADGTRLYLADEQGAIALFSRDADSGELTYVSTFAAVDGLAGISQLLLSADGTSLYALRADSNAIAWFSADAAGTLTHQATIISDYGVDGGNLYGIQSIALSADGRNLYLVNAYNVAYFSRDTTTGALSYVGEIAGSMWSEPYLWQPTDIVIQDDLVFVVTSASSGSTLIVYQRDANGALELLGYTRSGSDSLTGLQHVTVSADGGTIFVASDSRIDAFSLDAASGTLTHLGSITGESIRDIAVSTDGKALFVTLADGTLNYYATATLALVSAQSGLDGAGQIALSADGGVLVVGDALEVLNAPPVAAPTFVIGGDPVLLAPALALGDAELDAAAGGAGSYQGASVTFGGQAGDVFGFQAGNGYTLDGDTIRLDGTAVATLTQAGGSATLSFTAALTKDQANALLRQITYAATTGEAGTRAVTLTLNDGAADSAVHTVLVTLLNVEDDNHAPVAGEDGYALTEATVGESYSIVLPEDLFSDADGDTLTWSVEGLPAGLSFDPATRTISGTPTAAGEIELTITVTDPSGASAERSLSLSVQAAGTEPEPEPEPEPTDEPSSEVAPSTLPADYFSATRFEAAEADGNERAPELFAATQPAAPASLAGLGAPALFDTPTPGHEAASAPPTARATLALLDTLHARREAESASAPAGALQLADGRVTPLVTLAAPDGPLLAASVEALRGAWRADVAGNRQVFALPAGLFASREPIAALTLRMADGRPLPANLRLDVERGLVIRSGLQGSSRVLELVLRVQTSDGRVLDIPITLNGLEQPDTPRDGDVPDAASQAAGKEALSLQLRESAARDLFAQARDFLATLGSDAAATPTSLPSGAAQTSAPAPLVSTES